MITLKTLPKATEQEVFDQVAKHLLEQGERSEFRDHCLYRGYEGQSCAAGCLIAADEYKKEFEEESWKGLVRLGKVPTKHLELIQSLQYIHDAEAPEDWKYELEKLAVKTGLEFNN